MKLLVLALLPSLSMAAVQVQDCNINVYDIINKERVYNHSTEGKVIDKGKVVGLRVNDEDFNHTSGILKLQKAKSTEVKYYNDISVGITNGIYVMKYIYEDGVTQYMIFNAPKSKTYNFFDCKDSEQ
ncbi:TPA: hypothetical protein U2I12_000717 [Citrobacter farmeri]|uniref:hypothetical protein n=1 Tax=Citrobacter farmeri TaxID=67824 RepID=UPI000F6707B8|nr:hypothetical protein [Citrobacter farmeri]RSB18609.1 hypothetical protein EGK65_02585 [Citrobacter farmeri]HEM6628075.1 hypothetical protein [Citrobacter farmeri]